MSQALPRSREANVLLQQVLRSATGMAANYRAAGRSRTKAEFIAKIGVVVEEADRNFILARDAGGQRARFPRESPETAGGSDPAPRNIHCIAQPRQREPQFDLLNSPPIPRDSVAIPAIPRDLLSLPKRFLQALALRRKKLRSVLSNVHVIFQTHTELAPDVDTR